MPNVIYFDWVPSDRPREHGLSGPLNHALGGLQPFPEPHAAMLRALDIQASPTAEPLLDAVGVLRSVRPTRAASPTTSSPPVPAHPAQAVLSMKFRGMEQVASGIKRLRSGRPDDAVTGSVGSVGAGQWLVEEAGGADRGQRRRALAVCPQGREGRVAKGTRRAVPTRRGLPTSSAPRCGLTSPPPFATLSPTASVAEMSKPHWRSPSRRGAFALLARLLATPASRSVTPQPPPFTDAWRTSGPPTTSATWSQGGPAPSGKRLKSQSTWTTDTVSSCRQTMRPTQLAQPEKSTGRR